MRSATAKTVQRGLLFLDLVFWSAVGIAMSVLDVKISDPVRVFCSLFSLFLVRETLFALVCRVVSKTKPTIRLLVSRVEFALLIALFLLAGVRYLGILGLAWSAPAFYLLGVVLAVFAGEPETVGEKSTDDVEFGQIKRRFGLGRIALCMIEGDKPTIYSQERPARVVVSKPVLGLPADERRFLFAHELAHVRKNHFIIKVLAEMAVLIVQSFLPYLSLALCSGAYWHAGRCPSLVHCTVPMLVMTIANPLSRWICLRLQAAFERSADTQALDMVQDVEVMARALRFVANGEDRAYDIEKEVSVEDRLAAQRRIHRLTLAGEMESHDSYACITFACNSQCRFCASDGTGTGLAMSVDDFKAFIAADNWKHRLVISGGEPLAHPEIAQLLELAGRNYKEVCLMTNGTLLASQSQWEKSMPGTFVPEMAIPLYGSSATMHDALTRFPGGFDAVVNALRLCAEKGAKVELKLLWSQFTAGENLKIIDLIARGDLPVPDVLSLTHLIVGKKAFRNGYLAADVNDCAVKDLLNQTVSRMADYGFTLQNIPLCWLDKDLLPKVLEREIVSPSVIRMLYASPSGKPKFVSAVPYEKPDCITCRLRARCSRFYPGQPAAVYRCFPTRPA
jgi:Zn-dependent protease with chaperone function